MCDVKFFCPGQTYTSYFSGKAQKREKKGSHGGVMVDLFPTEQEYAFGCSRIGAPATLITTKQTGNLLAGSNPPSTTHKKQSRWHHTATFFLVSDHHIIPPARTLYQSVFHTASPAL